MNLRRLAGIAAQYVPLIAAVLVVNFLLPRMMPGGPLQAIAGDGVANLTPAELADLRRAHGLDDPIFVQFGRYLVSTLSGQLGDSLRAMRPVVDVVGERVPWTLLLAGSALAIAATLAVPLGAYSATRRGRGRELVATTVIVSLRSIPSFWLGMVAIGVFSVSLGWLPPFGAKGLTTPDAPVDQAIDIVRHLVMPVLVLACGYAPFLYLTTRAAVLSVLNEPYVGLAVSKGLHRRTIMRRHVMRNALPPILTVLVLEIGTVIGGALVVETVFAYPGLGRLMYESVLARDYPVLQAAFLLTATSVIVANALADVAYPIIDPRAR